MNGGVMGVVVVIREWVGGPSAQLLKVKVVVMVMVMVAVSSSDDEIGGVVMVVAVAAAWRWWWWIECVMHASKKEVAFIFSLTIFNVLQSEQGMPPL
ncbi:hypothetical protein BVC80_1545g8 [Macleaya cordata]|uniref:Transmembrane protein n=1 Tax=Macleaya cordata TaxID=56857 RepID=A0A200R1H7_MACCD|nr:hypothetical protein BVC80_1545g8 [Macleaya cordata]